MKRFFQYLKDNNIQHEFNPITSETYINRNLFNHEFRAFIIDLGLNIFELDTIIVIH
jgi:hypothetical protein